MTTPSLGDDSQTDEETVLIQGQPLGGSGSSSSSSKGGVASLPLPGETPALAIFTLLGIGMLFPWNAFINAEDYFRSRFVGTMFEGDHLNIFTLSYQVTNMIGVILASNYMRSVTPWSLSVPSLAGLAVVFIVTTILASVDVIDSGALMGITIVCCLLSGLFSAFVSSGVFGLAGNFPGKHTAGIMIGQGERAIDEWPRRDERMRALAPFFFFFSLLSHTQRVFVCSFAFLTSMIPCSMSEPVLHARITQNPRHHVHTVLSILLQVLPA